MASDDDRWVYRGPEAQLPSLEVPLGVYLLQQLRSRDGDKILQVDGVSGEAVTGRQLEERAIAVAEELRRRGIGPGDVVSIAMDNALEVSYILLGTLLAGAVYAPINVGLDAADLRHTVNVLEPRLVFCCPRASATVRAALPPEVQVVEVRRGGVWDEFLRAPSADFQPARDLDLGATAVIMCSSGTTGPPKGVMLSHTALHTLLVLVDDYERGTDTSKNVILLVSQNFWISGFTMTLFNINSGFKVIIYEKFEVNVWLESVQKNRVTHVLLAPQQVAAIAKHPNAEKYDASSITSFIYGGASLSPKLRSIVEERLKVTLRNYYGQTECLLAVAAASANDSKEKPNTAGKAAKNGSIKIIDPESGKTIGPLTEGEICTKNGSKFSGYYKNPEATANTIDEDGWIHTGDVGYIDEDGFLFICDRFKELIKYRGNQIAPADIENVLMSHEAVQDAAVVGVDNEEDQEHPVGFVVLQKGQDTTKEELLGMVRDQLPTYKHLHGGIHFIEEIPRTATGKTKRRDLRQTAKSLCNNTT